MPEASEETPTIEQAEKPKKARPPKSEKQIEAMKRAQKVYQEKVLPIRKEEAQIKRDEKRKKELEQRMDKLNEKMGKLKVKPPPPESESESESAADGIDLRVFTNPPASFW